MASGDLVAGCDLVAVVASYDSRFPLVTGTVQ